MSVRGVAETVAKVRKRVETTWATSVAADQQPGVAAQTASAPPSAAPDRQTDSPLDTPQDTVPAGPAWPHRFPVGRAASADLGSNFGAYVRQLGEWRDWAEHHGVELVYAKRDVAGTRQEVVSHVVVPTLDTAARVAGEPWPGLVATARARAAALHQRFPDQPSLPRSVRGATRLSDVEFEILIHVCAYFLDREAGAVASGVQTAPLTPRQVPIEGVHAKWLDSNQGLVRTVTGLADLGLLPPHPPRFHFTYLDREHGDRGGRRHDSYSVGDTARLSYEPRVVLITENKDTAIGFPSVPGGIAIEGEGRGATTITSAPWVRTAPLIVYWGDLDQDGLEILNEFRATGLTVESMLMNVETYDRYRRYGTTLDRHNKPVKVHPARDVPHLNPEERVLYELLSSGSAPVPRIEQERIPLEVPAARLEELVSAFDTASPAGSQLLDATCGLHA